MTPEEQKRLEEIRRLVDSGATHQLGFRDVEVLLAAVTRLAEERDRQYDENVSQIARIHAAQDESARLRAALEPFASGGNWGKVKAWIVEGTRVLDKVSDGLDAAQEITRWQVAADAALAPPGDAAP